MSSATLHASVLMPANQNSLLANKAKLSSFLAAAASKTSASAVKPAPASLEAFMEARRPFLTSSAPSSYAQKTVMVAGAAVAADILAAAKDASKRSLLIAAITGKSRSQLTADQLQKVNHFLDDVAAGKVSLPKVSAAATSSDQTAFTSSKTDHWFSPDMIPVGINGAYVAGPNGGRILISADIGAKATKTLQHEFGEALASAAAAAGIVVGPGEAGDRMVFALAGKDPSKVASLNREGTSDIVMIRLGGKLVKAHADANTDFQTVKTLFPSYQARITVAQNDVIIAWLHANNKVPANWTRLQIIDNANYPTWSKQWADAVKVAHSLDNSKPDEIQQVANRYKAILLTNAAWSSQDADLYAASLTLAREATPAECYQFSKSDPSLTNKLKTVFDVEVGSSAAATYMADWLTKVNQGQAVSGAANVADTMLNKTAAGTANAQAAYDQATKTLGLAATDPMTKTLSGIRAAIGSLTTRSSVAWVRLWGALHEAATLVSQGKPIGTLGTQVGNAINELAASPSFSGVYGGLKAVTGMFKVLIGPLVVVGMGLDIANNKFETAPGPAAIGLASTFAYLCGIPALMKSGIDDLKVVFKSVTTSVQRLNTLATEFADLTLVERSAAMDLQAASQAARQVSLGQAVNTSAALSDAADAIATTDLRANAASIRSLETIDSTTGTVIARAGSAAGATAAEVTETAEAATIAARVGSLGKAALTAPFMKGTFGVGDILLGAATIWQGAEDIKDHKEVKGALEVTSGAVSAVAGASMLAALACPLTAPVTVPLAIGATIVSAGLNFLAFFW